MGDVGDEAEVISKKSAYKLKQEDEIHQLYELLEDYKFRAFLWRILEMCNIYSSAPITGMDRFEGQRDIGLKILDEIFTANPEGYTLLRREAESRKQGSIVTAEKRKK